MSRKIEDKADVADARTQQTRGFMQQVRVAARRKRQALSELGIARSTYYRWRQGQR